LAGNVVAKEGEVFSKPRITPKSKAPADEKAQHTCVCEHFEEVGNAAIGCQAGL
jgi:hypothetical protein